MNLLSILLVLLAGRKMAADLTHINPPCKFPIPAIEFPSMANLKETHHVR